MRRYIQGVRAQCRLREDREKQCDYTKCGVFVLEQAVCRRLCMYDSGTAGPPWCQSTSVFSGCVDQWGSGWQVGRRGRLKTAAEYGTS